MINFCKLKIIGNDITVIIIIIFVIISHCSDGLKDEECKDIARSHRGKNQVKI